MRPILHSSAGDFEEDITDLGGALGGEAPQLAAADGDVHGAALALHVV